jgi:vacuole morphology and inheritance protein 14
MPDIDKYLNLLIPPVLECFDDPESRVCYYACESMYNIAKVARGGVLRFFNQIFDGLCKLYAHADIDVKSGANLLDRLIKDIVTDSDTFDIENFIPLLKKHITRTKPYIRQLLVSWLTVLDAVPDINLLDYIPEFLEGLFNMLSDVNKEIVQSAGNVLGEFLKEIKGTEVVAFGPMIEILVRYSIRLQL